MYNIESFMNLSYFIVLESFSALETHFLLVSSFDSYKIIEKRQTQLYGVLNRQRLVMFAKCVTFIANLV